MVKNIAFLFPGQGSQYIGMGKDAAERSSQAKSLFEKADEILGFSISEILFQGPEEKLKETAITQPALFLASAAALECLKEKDIHASFVAGHSLGEYSALYAAGAIDFETALKLVHERGMAMNECATNQPGTMAAILGLSPEKISNVCTKVSQDIGVCSVANFNSDSQTVISGTVEAISKAMELAKEGGALRTIQLNVSGAFHSSLMSPAALSMAPKIQNASFSSTSIPVVTNVDAEPTTDAMDFQKNLIAQIDHSVRWNETMKKLISMGAETCIEVGAGSVLSNLMKKCDRKKTVCRTDDMETLEKIFSQIPS